MATTQTNKELFQRIFDALNDRDFDALADTHTDDVVLRDHDEEFHGVEAVIEHERTRYDAFPDMEYTPEDALAEDDMIAGRWTVTGTHEGEIEGIKPTGETVEFPAYGVMRVEEGEVAEVWLTYDRLGMLQQLGVIEPPGESHDQEEDTMATTTAEENKELARRMVEDVWSRGDLDVVDDITATDYEEYDPVLPEIVRGRDTFKETVMLFREPMPDLVKHIEGIYVDGDIVTVHYRATGTPEDELLGVQPTGESVEVQGVFLYTVEDGKLAEGIDIWDAYGVLQQLGALPTPQATD